VRNKIVVTIFVSCLLPLAAQAQGMLSDMMSGKLINPEVGAFAWYTLTDTSTNREYFLRQAVVGKERVNRKDAHWLETELVPKVGFPSVYKMLLTGPARDPKNVHRLIVREGKGIPQEVQLDRSQKVAGEKETSRTSLGIKRVKTPGGEVEAEHFVVNGAGGGMEIWVSDQIKPMGLVRMKNNQGEMLLQRHGVGGKDGQSALPEIQSEEESADETVTPKKSKKPKKSRRNTRGPRR
jgi:hypothetical protein